jgi:hypothetical protein
VIVENEHFGRFRHAGIKRVRVQPAETRREIAVLRRRDVLISKKMTRCFSSAARIAAITSSSSVSDRSTASMTAPIVGVSILTRKAGMIGSSGQE